MSSNFKSNSTDLDDIFIALSDTIFDGTSSSYGQLWTWGRNNSGGLLGQGNTTNCSSPIQVGSLTNWKQVVSGQYHTTSIKKDGSLWAWGQNQQQQLGQSETPFSPPARSSPTQVGTLTNWIQVSNGWTHSFGIKTDGTLWTWGHNGSGQLGLNQAGNGVASSSPTQVGTLTNWKQASGGYKHSLVVKKDGTLWAMGFNYNGELGQGDVSNCSSPVQVGTLTNWKLVACGKYSSGSIKNDGTLWTWGLNIYGNLGQGNTTNYSSPVQVGTLTNWKLLSQNFKNMASIKNDGTLWTWGHNAYGQLGTGNVTHYSSPVQVGSLTDWKQVVMGSNHTASIKTDGTLWAWGYNTWGNLGQGDVSDRSSPVQVGSLTYWKHVSCGGDNFTIAILNPNLP